MQLNIPDTDLSVFKSLDLVIVRKISKNTSNSIYLAESQPSLTESNTNEDQSKQKLFVKFIDTRNLVNHQENIESFSVLINLERYKAVITRISHKNIADVRMCMSLGESVLRTIAKLETFGSSKLPVFISSTREIRPTYHRVYTFTTYSELACLHKYLIKHRTVDQQMAKLWCRQLAEALQYLHRNRVTHGNIHCRNVLLFNESVTNEIVVKLTDIGVHHINSNLYIGLLYDSNNYINDVRQLGIKVFKPVFDSTSFSSTEERAVALSLCDIMSGQIFMDKLMENNWFKS